MLTRESANAIAIVCLIMASCFSRGRYTRRSLGVKLDTMKDEDYRKATECCKILDCENCPIKEEDYCQEWLDFEKYKREHQD